MNKKVLLLITSSLILTLACSFITQPLQKDSVPTQSAESFPFLQNFNPEMK
jgi:hypothetical protein